MPHTSFLSHWQQFAAPLFAALASCSSAPRNFPQPTAEELAYSSGDTSFKGFDLQEAKDAIEFCVDLDSQDDRLFTREALKNAQNSPEQRQTLEANLQGFTPQLDPARWNLKPLFDSRQAVADAYLAYKQLPAQASGDLAEDDLRHWHKLFEDLEKRAESLKIDMASLMDSSVIYNDPRLNGFGPWQNAWVLYQGVGVNAGRFAVAIRGTVMSSHPSVVDDVYFQPAYARSFLSKHFQLTDHPGAAVHSGFAHATFSTLLDLRFGILPVLEKLVPPGADVYVIGHSQGAGIATLVHAALHYGMLAGDVRGDNALGLKGKRYRLKSYQFAQPKPGDMGFSASFARITQATDNAFVINNDLDPIVQVPLTLQTVGDLSTDFRTQSLLARAVRGISTFGIYIRRGLGHVLEKHTRESSAGYAYYYNYLQLAGPDRKLEQIAVSPSWNFTSAGRVMWVYGQKPPAANSKDDFYQHHATTYRVLLDQLASPTPPAVQPLAGVEP
ncbi:hypothetical protein ACA097_04175 [Pseudomonas sp. QL9]|uniref:lipase family protein n=1 Tax=Pseudomonas sp. QL9 TaxID=3242725 RepID=UPI00352B5199